MSCSHIFSSKAKKAGKKCGSKADASGYCGRHLMPLLEKNLPLVKIASETLVLEAKIAELERALTIERKLRQEGDRAIEVMDLRMAEMRSRNKD